MPYDTVVMVTAETSMCHGCKHDLPAEQFAKDARRKNGLRYNCRACAAAHFSEWQKTAAYTKRVAKYKADRRTRKTEDPIGRWAEMALSASRARAKKSGLEHTLTHGWLVANAPAACPLLEEPLQYNNTRTASFSPAVDRIDNEQGYTPENCWVVSMIANRIKTNATLEQIELAARNLRKRVDAQRG